MNRLGSLLLAAVLLLGLVIAFDPEARARATAFTGEFEPTLQRLDETIVVNVPSVVPVELTAVSTPTPFIPVTGDDDDVEDSGDEPIIEINWDALGDSLRTLWESLLARFNTDIKKDGK